MIKFNDLKDGMILELQTDIDNSPLANRRVKNDWRKLPVIPKGTRFLVKEDATDIDDVGTTWHAKWFTLERHAERYSSNHRLSVHAQLHKLSDPKRYLLGQLVLANCEVPALTFSDHSGRDLV